VEMTEKPWCLADLKFEPMGDDLRERRPRLTVLKS